MTILEAHYDLFRFFRENGDVFDLGEHFADIVPVSIDAKLERDILKASLTEFENLELVKRFTHKSDVWVLTRPIDDYTQTLQLDGGIAVDLAETVNAVCKVQGQPQRVDPLKITGSDVHALVALTRRLIQDRQENAQ